MIEIGLLPSQRHDRGDFLSDAGKAFCRFNLPSSFSRLSISRAQLSSFIIIKTGRQYQLGHCALIIKAGIYPYNLQGICGLCGAGQNVCLRAGNRSGRKLTFNLKRGAKQVKRTSELSSVLNWCQPSSHVIFRARPAHRPLFPYRQQQNWRA